VSMPRWLIYTAVVLVVLSWVPLAFILKARTSKSSRPRVHVVQDMDNQPKFRAQARNRLFADRRAMRPAIPGTIARGQMADDTAVATGKIDGEWITAMPVSVDLEMLKRGRERYDVFCSPCHGLAGYGDGMVAKRADELQEGTWTPPSSFHTDLVRSRPAGHLYNSIANGIRNMPSYGSQISVDDRWAIVAYVTTLQRSQNATTDDVPADLRAQLR